MALFLCQKPPSSLLPLPIHAYLSLPRIFLSLSALSHPIPHPFSSKPPAPEPTPSLPDDDPTPTSTLSAEQLSRPSLRRLIAASRCPNITPPNSTTQTPAPSPLSDTPLFLNYSFSSQHSLSLISHTADISFIISTTFPPRQNPHLVGELSLLFSPSQRHLLLHPTPCRHAPAPYPQPPQHMHPLSLATSLIILSHAVATFNSSLPTLLHAHHLCFLLFPPTSLPQQPSPFGKSSSASLHMKPYVLASRR